MKRRRLEHLIQVLEKVRDEKRPFKMWAWIDGSPWVAPSLEVPVKECGTASCALGWLSRDPWANKRGLINRDGSVYTYDTEEGEPPVGRALNDAHYRRPDIQEGIGAGEKFFNIDERTSTWLFDPATYRTIRDGGDITPDEVIARVKKLLDGTHKKERSFTRIET